MAKWVDVNTAGRDGRVGEASAGWASRSPPRIVSRTATRRIKPSIGGPRPGLYPLIEGQVKESDAEGAGEDDHAQGEQRPAEAAVPVHQKLTSSASATKSSAR